MNVSKPASSDASRLENLGGLVERVTFHNADNGFCVLRVKVKGQRDLLTVIGHTPSISPGEYVTAGGA
jgi:exodeoxyribonuclease V alpha subunit